MRNVLIALFLSLFLALGAQTTTNLTLLRAGEVEPVYPDGGVAALMAYLERGAYHDEESSGSIYLKAEYRITIGTDGRVADVVSMDKELICSQIDSLDRALLWSMPCRTAGRGAEGEALEFVYALGIWHRVSLDRLSIRHNKGSDPRSTEVETLPQYPKGAAALGEYLRVRNKCRTRHRSYVEPTVISFVITKEGRVVSPKVERRGEVFYSSKDLLRMVADMPRWVPAKQNRRAVGVKHLAVIPHYYREERIPSQSTENVRLCLVVPQGVYQGHQLDKAPVFPFGDSELFKYLAKNVRIRSDSNEGGSDVPRVIVSFVIDRKGDVRDIRIAQSLGELFDKEAFRVVQQMPNWIPGELNGERVEVMFEMPVTFRLQ